MSKVPGVAVICCRKSAVPCRVRTEATRHLPCHLVPELLLGSTIAAKIITVLTRYRPTVLELI